MNELMKRAQSTYRVIYFQELRPILCSGIFPPKLIPAKQKQILVNE